ncbi:hypothetical protein Y032_0005g2630 [Ancylostoma ceylanicum]|uniref:Uncharacterized protein n=1 Tax=Ancylostoma ceylanicum TaxID=53326 RepID=A0A016VUF5_9BILA|nr:hypothetical protein Y032_0005g2630 [Ancylostoma ceylanicum]
MNGKGSQENNKEWKCDEVIRWLDSNLAADKDEFEHQQKKFGSALKKTFSSKLVNLIKVHSRSVLQNYAEPTIIVIIVLRICDQARPTVRFLRGIEMLMFYQVQLAFQMYHTSLFCTALAADENQELSF